MEPDNRAGIDRRDGSSRKFRLTSIDTSSSHFLDEDYNRRVFAEFLGIEAEELPSDFSNGVRTVSIGDHTATIIVDSQLSNGRFCCIEMQHTKDFGPPLHIHTREDEIFLILEGHYLYQVGENLQELKRGDLLLAPKGVAHSFRCLSEMGRTLVSTVPGGFEEYFVGVGNLSPVDFKEGVLSLSQQFGIQFVGPPIDPSVRFWEEK